MTAFGDEVPETGRSRFDLCFRKLDGDRRGQVLLMEAKGQLLGEHRNEKIKSIKGKVNHFLENFAYRPATEANAWLLEQRERRPAGFPGAPFTPAERAVWLSLPSNLSTDLILISPAFDERAIESLEEFFVREGRRRHFDRLELWRIHTPLMPAVNQADRKSDAWVYRL